MRITFISNFVSHHQQPFCEELLKKRDITFRFISLSRLNKEKKNLGWEVDENIFEIKAYNTDVDNSEILSIIKNSDVIILSQQYVPEWISICLDNTNALIFEYGERLFKDGKYKFLSPRGVINRFKYYYFKKHKNRYMLCASAYAASDLAICGLFLGKCLKWGYFPKTYEYNIDRILEKKNKRKILWVGRFLDWKRPDVAISIAKKLKQNNVYFEMEIIGDGPLKENLYELVKTYDLVNNVKFLGNMSYKKVREHMVSAGIFLATSNSKEGWGAVVNEAMNSGCAVVASCDMGSVPFLIENKKNGLSYKYKKKYIPYSEIADLLTNEKKQQYMGKNAYNTIQNEWNEKVAADRFLELIKLISKREKNKFVNGPCSKAKILNKY